MTKKKRLAPLSSGVQEKVEDWDKHDSEAMKREMIPGTRQPYTYVQALTTVWPDLWKYIAYMTQS